MNELVLGVWFRYAPGRRVLHLCQWVKTDRGLNVRARCGGQVIDPTAPEVPAHLAIPADEQTALSTIQPQQRQALCRSCRQVTAVAA